MTRGSLVIWLSSAIGIAAVVALFAVTRTEARSPTTPATPAPVALASLPLVNDVSAVAPPDALVPAPSTAGVASVADPGGPPIDPIADDSWRLLKPGDPPPPGDPFEDPEVKVPRAKLLSRVGVIRVGVLNKDAVVRDEAAVTSVLRRAAVEIERLDRDRKDPPHQRFPEYEAVMAKYRSELAPHMTGTAMIGGLGWALGVKVPGDAGS